MCFGGSSIPRPQPVPPSPPPPSTQIIDQTDKTAGQKEKDRQRAMAGRESTILASKAQNFLPPTGQAKTALGS